METKKYCVFTVLERGVITEGVLFFPYSNTSWSVLFLLYYFLKKNQEHRAAYRDSCGPFL